MLFLFSIITIQGTGAWFERYANLTPGEDKVQVNVGDLRWAQVLTNFLGADSLLPGAYGAVRTIEISNTGGSSDATFYYAFDLTPNNTSSILWIGNNLELIVIKDSVQVFRGPVSTFDWDYAFAKAEGYQLAPGATHVITFQLHLTSAAGINHANESLSFDVSVSALQIQALD